MLKGRSDVDDDATPFGVIQACSTENGVGELIGALTGGRGTKSTTTRIAVEEVSGSFNFPGSRKIQKDFSPLVHAVWTQSSRQKAEKVPRDAVHRRATAKNREFLLCFPSFLPQAARHTVRSQHDG